MSDSRRATAENGGQGGPKADSSLSLLSVERIWDKAPHNAFTAVCRHEGALLCAFREAQGHHAGDRPDSLIRIIRSTDGDQWESVATFSDPRGDIRDAKLGLLPDGRVMILTAVRLMGNPDQRHQSVVWLSNDLQQWQGPIDVGEPDIWLWGIAWHKGAGYSIGYSTGQSGGKAVRFVRLYRTTDGVNFEVLVEDLRIASEYPNESAIVFGADDRAYALLRCDPDPAWVGTAAPPYTQWDWKQSGTRVGGPALTLTDDGRLLAAGRIYVQPRRTSLIWVDAQSGRLTEALALPSGGDTSYPGFAWVGDELYMSYYSSHEQRTSIYLARFGYRQ